MKIKYHGLCVSIDKDKWNALSIKKKKDVVTDYIYSEFKYRIEYMKHYWLGYVDIKENNILCDDDNLTNVIGEDNIAKLKNKILDVTISVSKYNKGQVFSHVSYDTCNQIIKEWDMLDKRIYCLHIGDMVYQEYDFTRRQKNILINKLKSILKKEWYLSED